MEYEIHQFMTVTGLECIQTLRPCGCWHETYYTSEGIIEMIRLQLCSTCFEQAGETLDQLALDKKRQLTLPLPS